MFRILMLKFASPATCNVGSCWYSGKALVPQWPVQSGVQPLQRCFMQSLTNGRGWVHCGCFLVPCSYTEVLKSITIMISTVITTTAIPSDAVAAGTSSPHWHPSIYTASVFACIGMADKLKVVSHTDHRHRR